MDHLGRTRPLLRLGHFGAPNRPFLAWTGEVAATETSLREGHIPPHTRARTRTRTRTRAHTHTHTHTHIHTHTLHNTMCQLGLLVLDRARIRPGGWPGSSSACGSPTRRHAGRWADGSRGAGRRRSEAAFWSRIPGGRDRGRRRAKGLGWSRVQEGGVADSHHEGRGREPVILAGCKQDKKV